MGSCIFLFFMYVFVLEGIINESIIVLKCLQ